MTADFSQLTPGGVCFFFLVASLLFFSVAVASRLPRINNAQAHALVRCCH